MIFWARMLVVCLVLSACGGGGGDSPGSGIDPRLARLDIYDAQRIRVLGDPGAGVMGIAPTTSDLPVDGSAQLTGFATLRVEGAQPLVLFGDARLDVDFGARAVSGAMTGFFGTVPGAGVQDFAGEVTVTDGTVARDLRLTYGGALSGGGQQLALSGSMTGAFLGDPVTALSAADLEPVVVQNGITRTGTLVLVAEQGVP